MKVLVIAACMLAVAVPVQAQRIAPAAYVVTETPASSVIVLSPDSTRKLSLRRHIWTGALVGTSLTAIAWAIAWSSGELGSDDGCWGCLFAVPMSLGIGATAGGIAGTLVYLVRRADQQRTSTEGGER